MCDSNSELLVLDHRKMMFEDCDVSGSPWDVVLINDTTLAATYPQENVIKLVSADSFLSWTLQETLILKFPDNVTFYIKALQCMGLIIGTVNVSIVKMQVA
jgi:hypothetical protein